MKEYIVITVRHEPDLSKKRPEPFREIVSAINIKEAQKKADSKRDGGFYLILAVIRRDCVNDVMRLL